jgi:hypothetical protein
LKASPAKEAPSHLHCHARLRLSPQLWVVDNTPLLNFFLSISQRRTPYYLFCLQATCLVPFNAAPIQKSWFKH